MAMKVRIKGVRSVVPDGQGGTIDLSLQGNVAVSVEYFDSDRPAQIIHSQDFYVATNQSIQEILDQIRQPGRNIAASRQQFVELQGNLLARVFDVE